jgi:DNA-binding XRE family transcriptional regulator
MERTHSEGDGCQPPHVIETMTQPEWAVAVSRAAQAAHGEETDLLYALVERDRYLTALHLAMALGASVEAIAVLRGVTTDEVWDGVCDRL